MEIITVTTLEEYIGKTLSIKDRWFPDDPLFPWFRGQDRAEWSLLPKLLRLTDGDLETESEIREEFCTRAPALSDYTRLSDVEVLSNWEWYFVMQHYGAPTRLLDWTESALIALYFALKSNKGDFDAAVWVLDPWWLNRTVIKTEEVIPPADAGTLSRDRDLVAPWLPGRFEKSAILPKWPVAVVPTHTMRRLSAQRSCFTIHGNENDGFKQVAGGRRKRSARLIKLEVPSWQVLKMRASLQACGIDETIIFPDLEALGRAVTLDWKESPSRLPHYGVFTRLMPSKIHGVGVFAIKNIKKGTSIFGADDGGVTWIDERKLKALKGESKKLYEDFAVYKEGRCGCPTTFNQLTPSWYLNESKTPNLSCERDYKFYAARNIRSGEELTVDYSKYSETKE